MTPEEVYRGLVSQHGPELSNLITSYVFFSPDQNQLFFEDYEEIFRRSRFQILFLKGYDYSAELGPKYLAHASSATFRSLRSRYPRCSNFMYEGMAGLLVKT